MASPLFDQLSIDLSKKLGDSVASATTNGDVYSSAERDLFLNNAHKRWLLVMIGAGNLNALGGYTRTDTQNLSSNVIAKSSLTGTALEIISGYNETNSVFIDRMPEDLRLDIVNERIPFLTPDTNQEYWSYEGANVRVYGAGASDSVTFHYVRSHTNLAAGDSGGAGDTLAPVQYHSQILDYALKEALEERQQVNDQQIAVIKEAGVEKQVTAG